MQFIDSWQEASRATHSKLGFTGSNNNKRQQLRNSYTADFTSGVNKINYEQISWSNAGAVYCPTPAVAHYSKGVLLRRYQLQASLLFNMTA
jgi:hypothetical protein